jgi:hypothetical protein
MTWVPAGHAAESSSGRRAVASACVGSISDASRDYFAM